MKTKNKILILTLIGMLLSPYIAIKAREVVDPVVTAKESISLLDIPTDVSLDEDITAEDLEIEEPKMLSTNIFYPLKNFNLYFHGCQ